MTGLAKNVRPCPGTPGEGFHVGEDIENAPSADFACYHSLISPAYYSFVYWRYWISAVCSITREGLAETPVSAVALPSPFLSRLGGGHGKDAVESTQVSWHHPRSGCDRLWQTCIDDIDRRSFWVRSCWVRVAPSPDEGGGACFASYSTWRRQREGCVALCGY